MNVHDLEPAELMMAALHTANTTIDQELKLGGLYTAYTEAEKVEPWSLDKPRDRFRAGLSVGISSLFMIRKAGDREENWKSAIGAARTALQRLDKTADRTLCKAAYRNIADAYARRKEGEATDNQDNEIAALELAIAMLSSEDEDDEWAELEFQLGQCHLNRLSGPSAEEIERAIRRFDEALYRTHRRPARAAASIYRGLAYLDRVHGARFENVRRAIDDFDDALSTISKRENVVFWAAAMRGRARALMEVRPEPQPELALKAFDHLLAVLKPSTYPQDRGNALVGKGAALLFLEQRDGRRTSRATDCFNRAIALLAPHSTDSAEARFKRATALCRREALPVRSRELGVARHDCVIAAEIFRANGRITPLIRSLSLLGSIDARLDNWSEAQKSFEEAEAALVDSLTPIPTDPFNMEKYKEGASLGASLSICETLSANPQSGLSRLNAGRSRSMQRLRALENAPLTENERRDIDILRSVITSFEAELSMATGEARDLIVQRLEDARRTLGQRLKAITEDADRHTDWVSIGLRGLQKIGATFVALACVEGATILYIVTPRGDVTSKRLSGDAHANLSQIASGWITRYKSAAKAKWTSAATQAWADSMTPALHTLWRALGEAISDSLRESHVRTGSRVALMLPGWMAHLPIGLSTDPDSGRCLFDDFEVMSIPTLAVCAHAGDEPDSPSLMSACNPRGNLPFATMEGRLVGASFDADRCHLFEGREATVENVVPTFKSSTHWHFASHAYFLPGAQALSNAGIELARDSGLMVSFLMNAPRALFDPPRLVVLSGCETGLSEAGEMSEEMLGLPIGFMHMGARAVISALWPLPDFAGALLIDKFFQHHISGREMPSTALRNAQLWLRTLTAEALSTLLPALSVRCPSGRLRIEIKEIGQWLRGLHPTSTPFDHMRYWGGFVVIGC